MSIIASTGSVTTQSIQTQQNQTANGVQKHHHKSQNSGSTQATAASSNSI